MGLPKRTSSSDHHVRQIYNSSSALHPQSANNNIRSQQLSNNDSLDTNLRRVRNIQQQTIEEGGARGGRAGVPGAASRMVESLNVFRAERLEEEGGVD